MPVKTLPADIILQIAGHLSYHDVVVARLVCKAWCYLLLPGFYRSVRLKSNAHAEQFSRIISGNQVFSADVSSYIKIMIIGYHPRHDRITQSSLILLEPYVPGLSQLQELCWQLSFVPDNLKFMKLFQTQCPQLNILTLLIPNSLDIKSRKGRSKYATMLGFKNLVQLTIEIECTPSDIDAQLLDPLKSIIINSPKLEYLDLDFGDTTVSPERLAASLGDDCTLPCLRRFYLYGGDDPESDVEESSPQNLSSAGPGHFKDFLSRHPHLEKLSLECSFSSELCGVLDASFLLQQLPMLEEFSGPYFFWDEITCPTVAANLQSLSINDWELDVDDYSEVPSYDKLELPALRKLQITLEKFPKAMDVLAVILRAIDDLDELHFPAVPQVDHEEFLEDLEIIPELQYLCFQVSNNNFSGMHSSNSSALSRDSIMLEQLVIEIESQYPELKVEILGRWE